MRKYELTAVFAGTISDTDMAAALGRVQTIISETGATDVVTAQIAKHRLSYLIDGNQFGHIVTFTFEAEPAIAQKLQKKLGLVSEIIRFNLELFVAERLKRTPQLADNPLIKASREREREERQDRSERADRPERQERTNTDHLVFATNHGTSQVEMAQSVEDKPIDLEEIDKKLDQLLQGDLTPTV